MDPRFYNNQPGAIPIPYPRNPVISTTTNEVSRGLINPIQRDTVTNTLIINSKFRKLAKPGAKRELSTNFITDLNHPISDVISLKVANVDFNNTTYNISEYLNNNTFGICCYIGTAPLTQITTMIIKIPDGSWEITKLVSEINTHLKNQNPPQNNFQFIECKYDTCLNKIIFNLTGQNPPLNLNFNLYFENSSVCHLPEPTNKFNTLGYLLGFTKSSYIFSKDYVPNDTYTKKEGFNPERCPDLSQGKFFFLEVDDFNKNAPPVLFYENEFFQVSNVLAKISNSSYSNFSSNSCNCVFKTRRYFGPVDLKKIQIRLLDEYGNVVDSNDSDLIITFEVETVTSPYKNMVQ